VTHRAPADDVRRPCARQLRGQGDSRRLTTSGDLVIRAALKEHKPPADSPPANSEPLDDIGGYSIPPQLVLTPLS